MGHGGARKGAGRPKGQAGPVAKMAKKKVLNALDSDRSPMDYILGVLNGTEEFDQVKFVAAKELLPYVHPKLANVQHAGDHDNPVSFNIVTSVDRAEDAKPKKIDQPKQIELTAEPVDGSYH